MRARTGACRQYHHGSWSPKRSKQRRLHAVDRQRLLQQHGTVSRVHVTELSPQPAAAVPLLVSPIVTGPWPWALQGSCATLPSMRTTWCAACVLHGVLLVLVPHQCMPHSPGAIQQRLAHAGSAHIAILHASSTSTSGILYCSVHGLQRIMTRMLRAARLLHCVRKLASKQVAPRTCQLHRGPRRGPMGGSCAARWRINASR